MTKNDSKNENNKVQKQKSISVEEWKERMRYFRLLVRVRKF